MFDFLGDLATAGAEGRGWRSRFAIVGLLIGAAAACYLGFSAGGLKGALTGLPTGALIGWSVAVFLRGFGLFIVIFLVVLAATFWYSWLTGG